MECSTTVVSVIRRSITVQPSSNLVLRQPKYNEKITKKISKQPRTVFPTKQQTVPDGSGAGDKFYSITGYIQAGRPPYFSGFGDEKPKHEM